MNTELIAETWGAIDDPMAFVESFYARFFERFPGYRPLFPQQLDPRHLEKMVQTMALVARMSEDRSLVAPADTFTHRLRVRQAAKLEAVERRGDLKWSRR